MKTFYTPSIALLTSIFIMNMIFSSCEKENTDKNNTNIGGETKGYSIKNGYLAFESTASFIKTTDSISNLTEKERCQWEDKLGFRSQRRLIDEVIRAEIISDSLLEQEYSNFDVTLLNSSDMHSMEYKNALKIGIIKTVNEGTDNEYWDYSVFNRGFVDFINEEGLFAIGDTLYQVTQKYLKAMKLADGKNQQKLIDASVPDTENKIFIIHEESNLKYASPGLIESDWVYSGGGKSGEKCIRIGIYLDVLYYIVSNKSYDFYHEVYVQCQERNWLRNWKYVFTNVTVNGSWEVRVFYIDQIYSNTWTVSGSYSYLKASINPQTGSSAPYQSYFHVNPSTENLNVPSYTADQSDYPPYFTRYNWSALRNGGCCGLTARLIK